MSEEDYKECSDAAADKQPDWTFDEEYSGQSPADRVNQTAELL